LRGLAEDGGAFVRSAWLERFARFMTTPGSHNDTYASTYIRMFFVNREAGKPLEACADNDGHNTDAIDALTLVAPVVLSAVARQEDVHATVTAFVSSTRRSSTLPTFCRVYANMLVSLLTRSAGAPAEALRAAAVQAGAELGVDVASMAASYRGRDPMCACYISSALPVLLVFAYKYAEDPVGALLASANAGGENVARGAALGALLGAAYGEAAWAGHPWLQADLKDHTAIAAEIAAALDTLPLA
jgi:ADP-ribosylglycohydrolase